MPAARPQTSGEVFEELDTTRGSVMHHLFSARSGTDAAKRKPRVFMAYVFTVAITYLPLLLIAVVDLPTLRQFSEKLRLPFLYDWNTLVLLTVSMPLLTTYLVTDQQVLSAAITGIIHDDVLSVTIPVARRVHDVWERRYSLVNTLSQLVGLGVGIILAWANYKTYARPDVGFWAFPDGRLTATGYVYLYCFFVSWTIVSIYILRSLTTTLFLHALVKDASIKFVPFHPDGCGGLRPVGRIGLRNQFSLSIFGVNLLLLAFVSIHFLKNSRQLYILLIAAAIGYILLGPVVFIGPLMPFRTGMLRTKRELMNVVAQRIRLELSRIYGSLSEGPVSKEDEELIDRLRKIRNLVGELPVWPFDAQTLRKFIAAYSVPLAGISYPMVKNLIGELFKQLGIQGL